MFVDRFMSTAMHYPCNYGYIPRTLSDDGDPCDVLVLSPVPLITGVVVRCRPIGMLKMDDEAGGDAKILAVPIDKLSSLYRAIESPRDLPEITIAQIAHFFEHYKDLEPGKWVQLAGWVGPEEAKREIVDGVDALREGAAQAARVDARRPADARCPAAAPHARAAAARSRRCSSCCGAPASSPRSTACRTRRPHVPAAAASRCVAALMTVVALALRAPWPRSRAQVGCTSPSPALLVHGVLPRRRVRRDRARHAGRHERDARRPAADADRRDRARVARRARRAAAVGGTRAGPRRRVFRRAPQDRLQRRPRGLVADRSSRSSRISVGTLYQKRYCAHVDLRSGAVIQFAACALVYVPLVAVRRGARRATGRRRSSSRSAGRCSCCRSARSACCTGCCATARRPTSRACSTWCRR